MRIREEIPIQKHLDFDVSIIAAQGAGIKVAWSNDIFEMWILLHFEKIPFDQPLNRTFVYDRLTQIFKHDVPRNAELDSLTVLETFNYKDNMKRRERFLNQVIPLIHTSTQTAIDNAKILESHFDNNVPFHMRNPCTMVTYLIQEILSANDK